MNRAKDLDTIAPDDLIETSPSNSENKKENQSTPPTKEPQTKPTAGFISVDQAVKDKIYTILGHTTTPFSAFLVKPKVFTFPEKDESEEIFLVARPHWFTNVSWILVVIAMIFVPLIFSALGLAKLLSIDSSFFPIKNQLVFVLFWYLITFIFAFEKFLSWYFNVFIITNERVVDIDFKNMLNKHFAEADLSMIQDVSSSVKGVAGTLFNYGTVLIQTASEVNQIIFEKVPSPEKIIKALQQLREAHEHELKGANQ